MNNAALFADEVSTEIESIQRAFQKLLAAQSVEETDDEKNNNETTEQWKT